MFRQVAPPLLGACALLLVFYGLGASAPFAILIGLLVWGGSWLLGWRRHAGTWPGTWPGLHRRRENPELMAAASRLETIRAAAGVLQQPALRSVMLNIVETAGGMLEEAFASASKRRRYRRALGHHLWHVEALASRAIGLERSGQADQALLERTADLMQKLRRTIEQARLESIGRDEADLDVRLSVIEREMDEQLGRQTVQSRAASRTEASRTGPQQTPPAP